MSIIYSSATPALDAGNAYATGDVMNSTAMTFAGVCGQSNGAVLKRVHVTDVIGQTGAFDLVLFNALPAAGTFGTINAAFAPTAAQVATIIAGITIPTATLTFSGSSIHTTVLTADISFPILAPGGTIYGVLVARAAATYTGAANLVVTLQLVDAY